MATWQATGFPPYVEPCSPGLMVSITSSSHSTADTWGTHTKTLTATVKKKKKLSKSIRRVTHGVDSSRQSFAQNHQIWTDPLVVHSQTPAGPGQARLHLVSDPQHLDESQRTSAVTSKAPRQVKRPLRSMCKTFLGPGNVCTWCCNAKLKSNWSFQGKHFHKLEGEEYKQY